jgi:small neutral amino acid transporter SnatA (MarC family)
VPEVTRNQAILIRAFCIWTVYVWANRIWNILNDETRSAGFKAVHSILAIISVAFAVAVFLVVRKIRRATQTPQSSS